jgi:hypothetical protein
MPHQVTKGIAEAAAGVLHNRLQARRDGTRHLWTYFLRRCAVPLLRQPDLLWNTQDEERQGDVLGLFVHHTTPQPRVRLYPGAEQVCNTLMTGLQLDINDDGPQSQSARMSVGRLNSDRCFVVRG